MRQQADPALVTEFRDWLREQRERRGLSQERFARMLDVPLNAYLRWERGVSLPSYPNLVRIRAVLGELPPSLMAWRSPPF